MFEIGLDQATGLRAHALARSGAGLMAVACPAQPARAYELLCTLAAHLTALDRAPVIVDGSASESARQPGLLDALQNPSVCGLAHPADGGEWLVMPGALGLQSLQDTAGAGGAGMALARLLAPFAPEALVLLFAPAFSLGRLLGGSTARVLVPVLEQPQATFDAYGAVKLLHTAGLAPVLVPQDAAALQPTVDTVTDCARRHLDLALEAWPVHAWGHRVQEAALTCAPRAGLTRPAAATRTAAAHPFWS